MHATNHKIQVILTNKKNIYIFIWPAKLRGSIHHKLRGQIILNFDIDWGIEKSADWKNIIKLKINDYPLSLRNSLNIGYDDDGAYQVEINSNSKTRIWYSKIHKDESFFYFVNLQIPSQKDLRIQR